MTVDAHGEDRILNIVFNGAKTLVGENDIMMWRFASYKSPLPPKLIICTDGSTMPTFSADKVDASSDDADERESDGAVNITFSLIRTHAHTEETYRYWGAHRFHNGAFPANGSTILEAQLVVCADTNDDANLDIYAEDAAGAPTFTTGNSDISDRTRTTASVSWVENSLGIGYWAAAPSLNTILQELVDDYTLTASALILKPKTDLVKSLDTYSYDHSATLTARLILTWTVPAPSAFMMKIMQY